MNVLSDERREEIVSRLLFGETVLSIGDRLIKITIPSPDIRVMANRVYNSTISKNRFEQCWLTEEQCLRTLVINGKCSPQIDQNIQEIQNTIEELKVKAYESIVDKDNHKKIRKQLDTVRHKYHDMVQIRHSLDHLTLKGFGEIAKRQYILYHTATDFNNGEKLWSSIDNMDVPLMEAITSSIIKQMISIEELREVARTDPWKAHWNISRGNPFTVPITNLSEEQKTVILFSNMYENVAKHPECPSDNIINDDDLFDGWMIIQRRNREKEQTTKEINTSLGDTVNKANEVYVVAKDKNRANEIYNMNDIGSKMVIKQRSQQIKAQGRVEDTNLLDKRLEAQQKSNEQFIQTVRGK